jgi:hypothetical protein
LEQELAGLSGDLQATGEAQSSSAELLATLQAALPTLEGQIGEAGQSIEANQQQTSALGQSIDALSSTSEKLASDLQSLATRLDDTDGKLDHIGGEYQRGAAMVVAIGDVDRAISKAEPFDQALQSLKVLVKDDAAMGETVAVLEPMAAGGVPTLGLLKSSFSETSSRALLAAGGDTSLTDKVSNNLFGIINMRPAGGDAEGEDIRAVLSRAQARLSSDDLNGAITELSSLDGDAAAAVGSWIEMAEGRLAAEAAVQDLRSHAQNLVARGS